MIYLVAHMYDTITSHFLETKIDKTFNRPTGPEALAKCSSQASRNQISSWRNWDSEPWNGISYKILQMV